MKNLDLLNLMCVFCGSSMGFDEKYRTVAVELGKQIAQRGMQLVYGGSSVGLMRLLADSALHNGGKVLGIIPEVLVEKNVCYDKITNSILCKNMAERKHLMIDKSDCFVALPGGIGTLDEITEVFTFNQLNNVTKPLALLNVDHFYDHFISHLDVCVDKGFIRIEHRKNLIVADSVDDLFEKIYSFKPIEIDSKWVEVIIENTESVLQDIDN